MITTRNYLPYVSTLTVNPGLRSTLGETFHCPKLSFPLSASAFFLAALLRSVNYYERRHDDRFRAFTQRPNKLIEILLPSCFVLFLFFPRRRHLQLFSGKVFLFAENHFTPFVFIIPLLNHIWQDLCSFYVKVIVEIRNR